MSCIVGIFDRYHNPLDESILQKPLSELKSHGTDRSHQEKLDYVAFGYRLMEFSPQDTYGNPLQHDKLANTLIAANSRLTNTTELKNLLKIEPIVKLPDSELIKLAYLQWGKNCTQYLEGEFAFAIFDKREKCLFCARDHMGVVPFYYSQSSRRFIFSTSIKGILSFPDISKTYDDEYIIRYLTSTLFDPSITFYKDINTLPAGHQLTIDKDNFTLEPYWHPRLDNETYNLDRHTCIDEFRTVLSNSVKNSLDSLTPLSISLSGGLDSGAIAGFGAKHLKDQNLPLHALTYRTEGEDFNKSLNRCFDETNYAKLVSEYHSNIQFHSHVLNIEKWCIEDLFKVFDHFQSPCKSSFLTYRTDSLSQILSQLNSRVMLDGLGGNILVSPGADSYYGQLMKDKRYLTLVNELKKRKRTYNEPYGTLVKRYLLRAFIKRKPKLNKQFMSTNLVYSYKDLLMELEREFEENIVASISPDKQKMFKYFRPRRQRSFEDAAEFKTFNKLDGRQPLWDKKLVEFCLSTPLEYNIVNGWDRSLIREATYDVLPAQVRSRTTRGYPVPDLPRWFYRHKTSIAQELDRISHSQSASYYLDCSSLTSVFKALENQWDNRTAHQLIHAMTLGSFIAWQEQVG